MSQPTQPPPQQPEGADPYAQQVPQQPYGQQPGYGYPPQAGYPQPPGPPPQTGYPQQPGHPQNPRYAQVPGQPAVNGWVQPAPAQVQDRFGLGLLAAVGAALVAVFVYAAILRFTDHEIGYVALVVGLLVGGAAGKAGGRKCRAVPVVAAVVSLLAVWFGQLTGIAWMTTHHYPEISFNQIFFDHFSDLVQSWKDHFIDVRDILFFAIAGVEGFVVTRRMAQR